MNVRPLLLLALGLGPLAASAVPALTVDYANLDYDNLATDTVDCSAKLTWTAGTAVDIQRRKGNEAAWTTLAEGDDSGEYLDSTVIPSVTYHYRLADGGGTGTEVDFLAVRHLPATGYSIWAYGDFTSQGWCKPAHRAFNGTTSADSYPDSNTANPQIGVDFGAATNYLAFVCLMPRTTDGCQGRLNGTVIYGSGEPGDGETEVTGTPLTTAISGAGGDTKWYTVEADSSAAYRCYYFQGAYGGNVNECAFFGWTAEDLDNATAIDLACSVARSDWENSFAIVSWAASAGTVTVQRKVGDEGEWTDLAESSAGSYTDEAPPYGQMLHYRIAKDGGTSPTVPFLRMRRLHTEGYTLFSNGGGESEGWYKPVGNAFDGNANTFPDMVFSTDARLGVDFGAASNYVAFVRFISRNDTGYRMGGFRLCGSGANWQSEATTLTAVVAGDNSIVLHELDADYSTAYRCYFAYDNDTDSYGNVAEIELYGWSAADMGQEIDLFDLSIVRSDLVDYYPVLSWNGGLPQDVSVQRRTGQYAWTTVATVSPDSGIFTDTTAKRGLLYDYRLVCGNDISQAIPFRRLRRIDVAGHILFSQGEPYGGGDDNHVKVFDGNTGTFADLTNYTNPKIGVDFGEATNVVAIVRVHPRGTLPYRMAGIRLYGSDDDAAAEVESAESDTPLTTAVTGDIENRWYEVPVNGDPAPYRTYYVRDLYEYGNVAEVEFYGWLVTDIPDPCTVILFR